LLALCSFLWRYPIYLLFSTPVWLNSHLVVETGKSFVTVLKEEWFKVSGNFCLKYKALFNASFEWNCYIDETAKPINSKSSQALLQKHFEAVNL
jgi:hypothetical protein